MQQMETKLQFLCSRERERVEMGEKAKVEVEFGLGVGLGLRLVGLVFRLELTLLGLR